MKLIRNQKRSQKGQTILEYFLVLTVILMPLALGIRDAMKDSEESKKDNLMRRITKDSYGDENRLGVIGRPYP